MTTTEIWLNGIRYEDIANEVNKLEAEELKAIAIKRFEDKTSHLAEKIRSENGTLKIILTEETIAYQFEGFSSELEAEMKEALKAH